MFKHYLEDLTSLPNLKAIFLSGAPISGKSSVSRKMFGNSLKEVNIDSFFEKLLKEKGIEDNTSPEAGIEYADSIVKRNELLKKLTEERKPLLIDGTGSYLPKLLQEKKDLETIGYDTFMVFVNVPLEEIERRNENIKNKEPGTRSRHFIPEKLKKSYKKVMSAQNKYKEKFGKNYYKVDIKTDDDYNPEKLKQKGDKILNKSPKNVLKVWKELNV